MRRSMLATFLVVLAFRPVGATPLPTTPTVAVSPSILTPFTSGGCFNPYQECYRVHGTADPGAKVTVTVTDEVHEDFSVGVTVFAAKQDDPGAGVHAGDWFASPNVTDLGTHGGEPSTLLFTAIAEDAKGDRSAPSLPAEATKVATTDGDFKPPRITQTRSGPSGAWCHLGANGAGVSPAPGIVVGACLVVVNPTDQCTNPSQPCTNPMRPGYGSWGVRQFTGIIEDNAPGSFGLASEIADLVIRITRTSDGAVIRELREFMRRGTTLYYNSKIFITDFEPGEYQSQVIAVDALGQVTETAKTTFVVTPL